MNEQARKALELAREAIFRIDIFGNEYETTAAIDAALSAPAAPVAQPLTDEQIDAGRRAPWGFDLDPYTAGVRFAERKHGIGQGDDA